MKKFDKLKDSVKEKIPDDWSILTIGEISEVVNGGTPSTKDPENFEGKIPWITPRDLSNYLFRYIEKGARNITQKGLQTSSAKLLPKDTVLLTSRAPVGYVAIAANEVTTNQGFKGLIPKENVLFEFLYYLLKSNTKYLKANSSGSTFGELNTKVLKSLKFLIPPLEEQYKISNFLSKIDEKIELNRQINDILEKIAQSIFKSWFIDFEPFQDGEFVESELRKMPKGWDVISISEIADYVNGKAFTVKATNTGRMIIKIAELKKGKNPTTKYYNKDVEKENLAFFDDILFAWSASLGIYRWYGDEGVINQHIFKVIPRDLPKWFVYYNIKLAMSWFIEIAKSKTTTMGHIKRSHLVEYRIIRPPNDIIDKLDLNINPIYSKIAVNNHEINILTQLRDLLLPQLISGRLRIENPENLLEEIGN